MKHINISISKKCQSWGQCVFDAPEIFSLKKGERVVWEYSAEYNLIDKVNNAVKNCPNFAIKYDVVDVD